MVLDDELVDFVEDYLVEDVEIECTYYRNTSINGVRARRFRFLDLTEEGRERLVGVIKDLREEQLEEIWSVNNDL